MLNVPLKLLHATIRFRTKSVQHCCSKRGRTRTKDPGNEEEVKELIANSVVETYLFT